MKRLMSLMAAAALSATPLLAQIERLDLSMGTMNDEDAQRLLDNAKYFKHLEFLSVGDNFISDAMVDRLRAEFGDIIDCSGQEEDDDWTYTSVGE